MRLPFIHAGGELGSIFCQRRSGILVRPGAGTALFMFKKRRAFFSHKTSKQAASKGAA